MPTCATALLLSMVLMGQALALEPGTYEIRAGSPRAVDIGDQIRPATLRIGPERESSSREVLLP